MASEASGIEHHPNRDGWEQPQKVFRFLIVTIVMIGFPLAAIEYSPRSWKTRWDNKFSKDYLIELLYSDVAREHRSRFESRLRELEGIAKNRGEISIRRVSLNDGSYVYTDKLDKQIPALKAHIRKLRETEVSQSFLVFSAKKFSSFLKERLE